jgi:DNA-binding beta-propeller fold protein YncE
MMGRSPIDPLGAAVSTRVRILPLVLLTNLAMLAPAAGAASPPRGSAQAQHVHATRQRAGWDAPNRRVAVARKAFSPELEGSGALGPLTSGPSPAPFGFGSALLGSSPVRPGPSAVAVDLATNTIYVANGDNANGPSPGGDTVSVIDGRRCDAADVSRCRGPWPTVNVGSLPSSVAVDQATDTVYVTILGDNSVAVFNGATCNGRVTWGCGHTPAHVLVGLGPFGIFADDANHTVYVGNPGPNFDQNTMSMINTLTCNGSDLAGCASQKPPMVPIAVAPGDFDVNQATHTVYVAIIPGVAAFDANTCNATVLSGCGRIGTLVDPLAASIGVTAVKVDSANNTIYVANATNTISAFDGRGCNANDLAGCAAETPGVVTVAPPVFFAVSFWLTVDAPLHTVYVVNQKNDNLAAVDTNACNGRDLPACATLNPPTIHTGGDPESVVINKDTQTLYTANQIDNTVSVIDASRCNADTTSGCRHPAPALTIPHPGGLAADPAAHTTYVTSGATAVSMIDTRTCNANRPAGCVQALPTVTVGDFPGAIAVDRRTHTVYVADSGAAGTGTVSVINARTCNATHSAGCASLPTLQVPAGNPDDIAINAATNTVYVATITSSGANVVSVFNGATCNAETSLGCHQTPATLAVGDSGDGHSSLNIAVNQATNTIYATNVVFPPSGPYIGDSVYMINGATCDAANTTGCGQTPATVKVGVNPSGIAVDQATNTIYTANLADGELAGSVSGINGATCNGSNTIGCGQTPQTVAAGFGSAGIAIDPTTHRVYVTNIEDTSVSVINGNTCNGSDTNGCGQSPPQIAVGSYPDPIAVDPAVDTAYVTNGDNTVSVIPLTP